MSTRELSLKNDVVFKELFSKKGNEIFLQDFLSDLLDIDIKKIEVQKDSTLNKEIVSEKYGILDIKATLNDNTTVDIEMQVTDYGNITQKHQKFYFIELSKFRNNKYDFKEKTEQWLAFIDGKDKKGVEIAMSKNNVIKKAKEELDYLTGDERLQRLAELREKSLKDRNSLYNYGYRTGNENGLKKGIKKGIEKGIEQGKLQERINIVKSLIEHNVDIETIMYVTRLTKEQIETLVK